MAGERNFSAHGKDTDLRVMAGLARRQHESRLGITELGRDRLHLRG
jgi:hypothetical protein